MAKMLLIFKDDLRRACSNTITLVAVLGLIILPSLFSWYNLLACWDVFDNTGNLKVAVANDDEGYQSDLIPLKVRMGEQVVSALRANDQMDWVFCSSEEAIDGARSGAYYAAVVIPREFSREMMSVFSDDTEQAPILYYTNEKVNAIAPKLTEIGADSVSGQVNTIFEQTLSEIALSMASSLMTYADEADATGQLGALAQHIASLGQRMDQSAGVEAYRSLFASTKQALEDSSGLVDQADQSIQKAMESFEGAKAAADEALGAGKAADKRLSEALAKAKDETAAANDAVNKAFDDAHSTSVAAMGSLEAMVSALKGLGMDDEAASVQKAYDDLKKADDDATAYRQSQNSKLADAAEWMVQTQSDYQNDVQPKMQDLLNSLSATSTAVSRTADLLHQAAGSLNSPLASIGQLLGGADGTLAEGAAQLRETGGSLDELSGRLAAALGQGDMDEVRSIIGSDPQRFAQELTAPVAIERVAVHPAGNFGSAMAPLYTTLALWIGALLIMVALKPQPGSQELRRAQEPSLRQAFFGRFGIVALISLLQSTLLALGNVLFIGIQVQHPWLYFVCMWVAGLVFAFIMYTLVSLFANLGKALGVILLVVQISGGGGSYPLALLPQPVQDISAYLPVSHAVNAMRAAMFGVYQNDFWVNIAVLATFAVPFILLVLLLIGPLRRFVPKFVARIEKSKVM